MHDSVGHGLPEAAPQTGHPEVEAPVSSMNTSRLGIESRIGIDGYAGRRATIVQGIVLLERRARAALKA